MICTSIDKTGHNNRGAGALFNDSNCKARYAYAESESNMADAAGIVIGVLIYVLFGLWAWHHLVFTSLLQIWVKADRKSMHERSFDEMNWSGKLCTSIFILVAIVTCLVGLLLLVIVGVYWLLIKAVRSLDSGESADPEDGVTSVSTEGGDADATTEDDVMAGWKDNGMVTYTAKVTAFLSTWALLDWERVLSGNCEYCREICSCCDKNKVHPDHHDAAMHVNRVQVQPAPVQDPDVPGTWRTDNLYQSKHITDSCDTQAVARRYVGSMKIGDNYFETRKDECYCSRCLPNPPADLPMRGDPPKPYALPVKWCKFGLKAHPKTEDRVLNIGETWHVAFHGTSSPNVVNILQTGELLMPNDVAMNGNIIKPPPGHFTDDKRPRSFDIYQIFCSPTIKYAGVPAYAPNTDWLDGQTGTEHKVQVALQLRIKPGCYKVGKQTIGLKEYQQIDKNFHNDELEWSTKHRGAAVITGLLVRIR